MKYDLCGRKSTVSFVEESVYKTELLTFSSTLLYILCEGLFKKEYNDVKTPSEVGVNLCMRVLPEKKNTSEMAVINSLASVVDVRSVEKRLNLVKIKRFDGIESICDWNSIVDAFMVLY